MSKINKKKPQINPCNCHQEDCEECKRNFLYELNTAVYYMVRKQDLVFVDGVTTVYGFIRGMRGYHLHDGCELKEFPD